VTASHLPRGECGHALNDQVHFYGGGRMSEHVAIVADAGGELGRATAEKEAP
jgi:hypothetical protein